jgi:hypothetical protein
MQAKLTKRTFARHSLDDLMDEIEMLIMTNVFIKLSKHPLYKGLLKAATAYSIHKAAKKKRKKERGSDDGEDHSLFTYGGTRGSEGTTNGSVASTTETLMTSAMIPGSVVSFEGTGVVAGEYATLTHSNTHLPTPSLARSLAHARTHATPRRATHSAHSQKAGCRRGCSPGAIVYYPRGRLHVAKKVALPRTFQVNVTRTRRSAFRGQTHVKGEYLAKYV